MQFLVLTSDRPKADLTSDLSILIFRFKPSFPCINSFLLAG